MPLWRSKEERAAAGEAKAAFQRLVAELETDPARSSEVATALKEQPIFAALSNRERRKLSDRGFRQYAATILADDYLTVQEEVAFIDLAEALGVEQGALDTTYRDILVRLAVARANDGRLNEVEAPKLMTKPSEAVYQELPAALMKEVVRREYRGGYSGFSFRIAKGVRYHTGASRGRSVVVGTELQVADQGMLSVSSHRVAFLGSRRTMEVPYSKLMSLEVFNDGIRFHASNRQQAPLFRVESGDLIAATVNAAMQRYEETGASRGSRRRTSAEG